MKRTTPLLLVCLLAPALAAAAVTLPFQGVLTDTQGAPLAAGTIVEFSLFDAETDGTLLWGPEAHRVTPDERGLVSVHLGDGDDPQPLEDAPLAAAEQLWLQIAVAGEPLSRLRVGQAARALDALRLDGRDAGDFAAAGHGHAFSDIEGVDVANALEGQVLRYHDGAWAPADAANTMGFWTLDQAFLFLNTPVNVGIGTLTPSVKLQVNGDVGVYGNGRLLIGTDDSTNDDSIFFDVGQREYLRWTFYRQRFAFSDDLAIAGNLLVGNTSALHVPYSRIGYGLTNHALRDASDLLVAGKLEVDGPLIADGGLQIEGPLAVADSTLHYAALIDGPGLAQQMEPATSVDVSTAGMADVVTVGIRAPGAGYVTVEASAQAVFAGTAGPNRIALQIDDTAGGSRDNDHYYYAGGAFGDAEEPFYMPVSLRRTFAVEGGFNYTFRLEAESMTFEGTRRLWNPTITAMFVPTAYGAVVTGPEGD